VNCVIYCLFNDAVSTVIFLALNGRAIGKGRKWPTGIIFQHLTGGVGRPRKVCQMWLQPRPRTPLVWLAQVASIKPVSSTALRVKSTVQDTTSTSTGFSNKHCSMKRRINNQLDADKLRFIDVISSNMFRASLCPSSGVQK
jgi:hypothetical protein